MVNINEKFFKDALNATKDLILIKGEKSRLLWANKAFCDLYGMEEKDLFSLIDGPQSDPDDTLQYVRDDQTVFDTKTHLDIQSETVKDSHGNPHNYHSIKSPIVSQGEVVQTIGISRYIPKSGEVKHGYSHVDAKEFSAPLRSITSHFPIPLVLIDIRERVINCSPLWSEEFGAIDEQSSANFFTESYPALSKLLPLIQSANAGKGIGEKTIELNKSKTSKHFVFRVDAWKYPNGANGGVTITASDITNVIHANERLKEANDELDLFAYSACHDLKSPLQNISILSNWISDDPVSQLSNENSKHLKTVKNRIKRMQDMLEGLYNYSQIGRHKSQTETIKLGPMLQSIIKELSVPEEFTFKVLAEGICVETNTKNLRTVLKHVIENGVKHHSHSKGIIDIKGSIEDRALQISIQDDGPGISESQHKKIFKLFKTIKSRDEFESNGIGLALVKKVLEDQGGSISLKSKIGEGSIFKITWPVK